MYANNLSSIQSKASTEQIVAIQNIDPNTMRASGLTRQGNCVDIDLRYHVGAIHVMPVVGEQWIAQRFGMAWVLLSKLPHATTDLLTEPVEGQVQIGSTGITQGPLHLNGSQVMVNAPLATQNVSFADRPNAATVPVGAQVYDTGLRLPLWSNGENWHDASGREYINHQAGDDFQAITVTITASATKT